MILVIRFCVLFEFDAEAELLIFEFFQLLVIVVLSNTLLWQRE
jgi:hypothetical protein